MTALHPAPGGCYVEREQPDVGPCADYRCRAESPFCAECERHHCAGCGHPPFYVTHRFYERACGCVYVEMRQVDRHDWPTMPAPETVVKLRDAETPHVRCPQHAAEHRERIAAQQRREAARIAVEARYRGYGNGRYQGD